MDVLRTNFPRASKRVFALPADACRASATSLTFRIAVQPASPIAELVVIQGTTT